MADPRIVMLDEHNCVSIQGPVIYQVRGGLLTVETIHAITREGLRNLAHHPRGVSVFTVLEQGAPVVDAAVRDLQAKTVGDLAAKHPFFTAVAIMGDDLGASMQRAVTRSAVVRVGKGKLLSSTKIPELADWVHTELTALNAKPPAAAEILAAMEWTRKKYAVNRAKP